jgi:hypothetical protein
MTSDTSERRRDLVVAGSKTRTVVFGQFSDRADSAQLGAVRTMLGLNFPFPVQRMAVSPRKSNEAKSGTCRESQDLYPESRHSELIRLAGFIGTSCLAQAYE